MSKILYVCDPKLNDFCQKTHCAHLVPDGECYCTSYSIFAKKDKNGNKEIVRVENNDNIKS